MRITYHRIFKKLYKKQSVEIRGKFRERLELFLCDPRHPLLNIHLLHGKWIGCRSFNVTGDLRVVFEQLEDDSIELIAIGTHSELYS